MLLTRFAARGHCYGPFDTNFEVCRETAEGRTEVCCRYDGLHVHTQGRRQRIAKRANDVLVRLCVAVRFGTFYQGGYSLWS